MTVASNDPDETVATATLDITVLDVRPTVTSITPSSIIENQSAHFVAMVTNGASETINYEWDFGDGLDHVTL